MKQNTLFIIICVLIHNKHKIPGKRKHGKKVRKATGGEALSHTFLLSLSQMGIALDTRGYTTVAGWAMILRPLVWRKQYTKAPTGHSTTAATANARKPRVGPTTLQRHGLLVVPHCMHMGIFFGFLLVLLFSRRQKEREGINKQNAE